MTETTTTFLVELWVGKPSFEGTEAWLRMNASAAVVAHRAEVTHGAATPGGLGAGWRSTLTAGGARSTTAPCWLRPRCSSS